MRARALREQQVDARRLLEATRTALASDADLLAAGEQEAIERLLEQLAARIAGTDTVALREATEALIAHTDEFAARRMDRSIRAALAGRSIAEVSR
jgi:molecular chaperone HscA